MRKACVVLVAALAVSTACSTKSSTSQGSSGAPSASASESGKLGQGVTADEIRLGITYVDLAAIRNVVNIDHGDYQTAYKAIVNDINAHGGINGRKIVPYFAPVNPIGTAPAAAACTKLTEDDKVFAVVGFFNADDPSCYVTTHDVPIVGAVALTAAQQKTAKAPAFDYVLSPQHLIPKELVALQKKGVFSGHKVAVFGLAGDQSDVNNVVVPQLKKLGVNVVQTAISDAPATDLPAVYSQIKLISQKFQSSGADVVVAVGTGGGTWLRALKANRDPYRPRLVATDANQILSYTQDKTNFDPSLLPGTISGGSTAPNDILWNDPAMQRCLSLVNAAHPSEKINNPITASNSTPNTWVSVTTSCSYINLFADIARAAGKTLNNQTFTSGGESLKDLSVPGAGGKLNYSADFHDGNGPVYLYTWDTKTQKLVGSVA